MATWYLFSVNVDTPPALTIDSGTPRDTLTAAGWSPPW
jgi:hypothetical protein